MPHLRPRYLAPLVEKAASLSPLVGILGHRQVGKTTLLTALASHYVTMDDEEAYRAATENSRRFLEAHAGQRTGIDECQLVPELFPALKEQVRKRSRPGMYLLSGSVRFTSRAAIRESLTGRIVNLELYPFTVTELEGAELSETVPRLLVTADLRRFQPDVLRKAVRSRRQKDMETYLTHGGLPGICFIRDTAFRARKIQDQLQTILDRDVRLVYPTTLPLRQLQDYAHALAARQGAPLSLSELRRESGISTITQRKLLGAFEAVYLLRLLPLSGRRKGFCVWFEDQAEALVLSGRKPSLEEQWNGLAFRHLRTQLGYRLGQDARLFQFHATSGMPVPFAIETADGALGFIPDAQQRPSRRALGAAQSFLRAYGNAKAVIFHPTLAGEPFAYDSRTWVTPLVDLV